MGPATAKGRMKVAMKPKAIRPGQRSGGRMPAFRPVQLATLVDHVPTGERWLHEMKYDGYRCLIAAGGGEARAYTRSGLDWSDHFTGVVKAAVGLKVIKKHIRIIRAKQSFGLPVGGAAARLLAELALVDTDQALRDGGITATRFVDDFRIFLRNSESPYDALGFLAEHLAINEGLSLNAAKTSVSTSSQYI
jgi:hypothetical protein